jgi:hypothetical protein
MVTSLSLFITPITMAFDKWEGLSTEEARTVVRLLDDLYKHYVVFDTINHVENQGRVPAATTTKQVFKEMEKRGWHSARLITTTDKFFNPENKPKDDFEKEAVQALSAGKDYFEKVETVDSKRSLRAATPVPAVLKECTMCHVYAKEGELMGAIVYTISIKQE